MTLFTVASIKGSPGVTTLTCLIAATWPEGRRIVVAECDSAGGDLAARFNLSARSGWSTLVPAVRRKGSETVVADHLQDLPGGLEILVGSAHDDASITDVPAHRAAQRTLIDFANTVDVLVDLGRLSHDLNSTEIWTKHSAFTCIALRPDSASVCHVRGQAERLRDKCGHRVGLLVVGRGDYSPTEITQFTGISLIGAVPIDAVGAGIAGGARGTERQLARSPLTAAACRIASALASNTYASSIEFGEQSDTRLARHELEVQP
jgi:hypothetical protein